MIKLNLARNCLRYLIRTYGIKRLFIPYYCCNSVWNSVRQENCEIKFYHIGKDFLPLTVLPKGEFILYINYYGMCDENCENLEKIYPKLIVDNTHAFYSKNTGLACFNSLRKFFPVQNGAYLYTENVSEENFESDKVLFSPVTMENNFEKFVQNERLLDNEPIKYICPFVEEFMKNFDFEKDKKERLKQFWEYHKKYSEYNKITLSPKGNEIPYCYPLSTDNKEIKEELMNLKRPLLSLWGGISENFSEYEFLNNTVALPLIKF